MKKTFALCLAVGLVIFLVPTKKASAVITEEEMNGNPIDNEDHFVWDIMAELQTPDDPDCTTVAEAALIAGGITNAEQRSGPLAGACNGIASLRENMESGMSGGADSTETNLFDAPDWHSVENLYFQHSTNGVPDGRIAFTNPIDFMSFNFMTFMMNFGAAMETSEGLIGLDADIVGGMAGYGAVLTMYNAGDFENPEILVDGAEDTEGVVSGLVYDRDAQTITFNAAHFSTFEVVEGSADETPKISKVKIQRYKSATGVDRLKIIILGNHFNKDTEVTLRGRSPFKTSLKQSGKIVAFYNLSKIKNAQDPKKLKMKLKVMNGDEIKRYKNRLLLSDLLKLKINELKNF